MITITHEDSIGQTSIKTQHFDSARRFIDALELLREEEKANHMPYVDDEDKANG